MRVITVLLLLVFGTLSVAQTVAPVTPTAPKQLTTPAVGPEGAPAHKKVPKHHVVASKHKTKPKGAK
jgi:hypothetical protein